MRVATVIVQVLVALVLTASLMPLLMATVPAVQDERAGLIVMVVLFVASFGAIALVWPRGRRTRR